MSPLDTRLITRKARLIEQDLRMLKEEKPTSLSVYQESVDAQLKVERLLEKIIGRLIDINYHILSEVYKTVPKDYYESFILMGEKGEVGRQLAAKLAVSSGLRNVLAHEYDEIDHKQVYKSISIALKQIPLYLRRILETANKNVTSKPNR